jgi:hypothetical protein
MRTDDVKLFPSWLNTKDVPSARIRTKENGISETLRSDGSPDDRI